MSFLEPILNIVRHHKKKIGFFLLSFLVFLYFLFPFNDMGDYVANKITQVTKGQVFVKFDTLDIGLIPQPSLELSKVVVDSAFVPELNIGRLAVSANLAGLLTFKPGVNMAANQLMGGDLYISTRGGDKVVVNKKPIDRNKQKVFVEIAKIDLAQASRAAQLPLSLSGKLSGDIESHLDPEFQEQPSMNVDLKVSKALLPGGNLNTPFGPLPLPRLNLNNIVLKAAMDNKPNKKDSLQITNFQLGKRGGDIFALVNGKIDVRFSRIGNNIRPNFGSYDLTVKLQIGPKAQGSLGPFLGFIKAHQKGGNNYAFRMTGTNFNQPPRLTGVN